MSALSVLTQAKELLSHRGAWTQNADARNKHGIPVDPMHPDAVGA